MYLAANLRRLINRGMTAVLLQLFGIIDWFAPTYGSWFKRVFFMMLVYDLLDQTKTAEDITLYTVNQRVLKIKKRTYLQSIFEAARNQELRLNPNQMGGEYTFQQMVKAALESDVQAKEFGQLLVKQIPKKLRYGDEQMKQDVAQLIRPNTIQV